MPGDNTQIAVFKQSTPNKNSGYHDCEYIPHTYSGVANPDVIHLTENPITSQPQVDIRFQGDGKDAFRIDYNQVFTPWSNPNSYRAASSSTPFGFELTNLSNGIYTLDIYVNTAESSSPATPQNMHVLDHNNHPYLSWDANTEPDIAGYFVYRQENSAAWEQIAYVSHPTTVYVDTDVNTEYTTDDYQYKVKATDTFK